MKKSVIIAALGLAVAGVSAFGQGQMTFNSYLANGSVGVLVNFSTALGSGTVGAGYSADLVYSLTPITEAAGNGALTAGWTLSGSGSPSYFNDVTTFGTTAATQGYFQGANNFELNPYTVGATVYFEVIAYQTSAGSYANSAIRGHSASFSTALATGINAPVDIGLAGFQSFTVSTVPEPATLALAGLGGLASLVMLRRKTA